MDYTHYYNPIQLRNLRDYICYYNPIQLRIFRDHPPAAAESLRGFSRVFFSFFFSSKTVFEHLGGRETIGPGPGNGPGNGREREVGSGRNREGTGREKKREEERRREKRTLCSQQP
jgi:hypothetical protein